MDFDAGVLGKLPIYAGIVWTDGGGQITILAFGPGGSPLGSATGVIHADASVSGTTVDDRFYGVVDAGGISRIVLSAGAAQEADHLQYGFAAVSGLTAREKWRQNYFGTSSNAGIAADTADPDQDGLVNILEFAFALDPKATSVLPVQSARNDGVFAYSYTRSTTAFRDGVLYFVEWSDDLKSGSWTSQEVASQVVEETDLIQVIEVAVPPNPGGKRFVRLKVVGN